MTFIEGLQRLLQTSDQLPTLPAVVFQLHAALNDEDVSATQVAAIIERDVALTARLLRAANSAAFSRGGTRVTTVTGAIQRLGLGQVRSLCLVLSVVQAFSGRGRQLDHEALWAHSAAVGLVARALWRHAGMQQHGSADDLYVVGLLHDVGLLIMDQFFPKEFDAALQGREELDLPLWQHEEDFLGMDHGEVGGLLLGRWGLPSAIVDGVTHHHHPDHAPAASRAFCRIVQAADAVCHDPALGLAVEGPASPPPEEALAALGIDAGRMPELLEELRELGREGRAMVAT
jgi:HD-like signal output (HDOD) protein